MGFMTARIRNDAKAKAAQPAGGAPMDSAPASSSTSVPNPDLVRSPRGGFMTYRIRSDVNSSQAVARETSKQRQLAADRAEVEHKLKSGMAVSRAKAIATSGDALLVCDREEALAAARRAVKQQSTINAHAKVHRLVSQKADQYEHMSPEDLLISPRPRIL